MKVRKSPGTKDWSKNSLEETRSPQRAKERTQPSLAPGTLWENKKRGRVQYCSSHRNGKFLWHGPLSKSVGKEVSRPFKELKRSFTGAETQDYLQSLCRARTAQTRDAESREEPSWAAEESTSRRSGSTAGASVVTNSNSVGHTSSMHPLPLPEPLDSSPGVGRVTKKVRPQPGKRRRAGDLGVVMGGHLPTEGLPPPDLSRFAFQWAALWWAGGRQENGCRKHSHVDFQLPG